MDFRSRIARVYQNKVIKPLEKRVRAVAITVDQQLVMLTPVDEGRARANWQTNLNAPILSEVPWTDKTKKSEGYIPDREAAAINVVGAYRITDKIYISNNLPYIQKLNGGSSKQAPAGFVQAAIEKGRRMLRK